MANINFIIFSFEHSLQNGLFLILHNITNKHFKKINSKLLHNLMFNNHKQTNQYVD